MKGPQDMTTTKIPKFHLRPSKALNFQIRALLLALTPLLLLSSCTGTRSWVDAPNANYPVSFSPSVRDSNGDIVSDEQLQKLGTFTHEHKSRHMLFGLIPLSKRHNDLSDEINEQVSKLNGQAIVNLKVQDFEGAWNMFGTMPFMGIPPIVNVVKIRGDIVRLADPAPSDPSDETPTDSTQTAQ